MMKNSLICTLFTFLIFSLLASTQSEIQHLLDYVESTACMYERNGDMHTGKEAVKHIKKKYDYFLDDIETTEDFIKYSATKSKMSGKYYLVYCPDKPAMKSHDWLFEELIDFRKTTGKYDK